MEIKLTYPTTHKIDKMIFDLLGILKEIGVPCNDTDRRLERMAKAAMALGAIKNNFKEAKSIEDGRVLKTRDIINFENKNYAEKISSGSYDDVRRKDLLYLVQAGVVVSSSTKTLQATNNPSRGYGLSESFTKMLHNFGTPNWKASLAAYKQKQKSLEKELARTRELNKFSVMLPSGAKVKLSGGEHNELQKAIVEIFLAKFGFNSEVLYLGDAENKFLVRNQEKLDGLGFFKVEHDELPDIVAYSKEKNILFLIEAVYSSGTMSEIRIKKLKAALQNCKAQLVFVTAFLDRKTFKKFVLDIAWETEVWITENPDHMIHFNGYKFLTAY